MEINTELNPAPHSERNHGIELLRIFAMLLAAVLHILKKGGVITASEGNLAAYSTVWLLEAAAYCAVNCYALISGYVGYSDRPKPRRLARCIELWLQVVFYSVIITTVYCIAGVGSVGGDVAVECVENAVHKVKLGSGGFPAGHIQFQVLVDVVLVLLLQFFATGQQLFLCKCLVIHRIHLFVFPVNVSAEISSALFYYNL